MAPRTTGTPLDRLAVSFDLHLQGEVSESTRRAYNMAVRELLAFRTDNGHPTGAKAIGTAHNENTSSGRPCRRPLAQPGAWKPSPSSQPETMLWSSSGPPYSSMGQPIRAHFPVTMTDGGSAVAFRTTRTFRTSN